MRARDEDGKRNLVRDNALGAAEDYSQFGWLGQAITIAGNTRRYAVSLVPENEVIIDQSYPLQMIHQTPKEVLTACRIAVQGVGIKSVVSGLLAALGADTTFTPLPANTKSFGVRLTLGDNVTSFKFGTYTVSLLDNATTLAKVYIVAKKQPIDLVLFGFTNVGGLASIVPISQPVVSVIGSANGSPTVTSSTAAWVETLNMRDIGIITKSTEDVNE
jgi:hypothetical protein